LNRGLADTLVETIGRRLEEKFSVMQEKFSAMQAKLAELRRDLTDRLEAVKEAAAKNTQLIDLRIQLADQVDAQISILIVDNGLEYIALSELWRVPLTRATNADFAHHYELQYI
jgi:predicted phage tail protein